MFYCRICGGEMWDDHDIFLGGHVECVQLEQWEKEQQQQSEKE